MIKICSWNIQAGGGSRVLSIAKALINSNSNVLALSEFRNNDSGVSLRNWLLKGGYRYQAVTHASKNENSVLIASKLPFHSEIYYDSDPIFSGNIIGAHFKAFSVLAVYLPHKKKHSLFEYIQAQIIESDKPFVIAGDYNTGINYKDQKGNSFWYTEQLAEFSKNGYKDAFRQVNGDVKEYSWFSHQGNGYRYDHTFVSNHLLPVVKDCYYKHDWRTNKWSDHSPMFLEIG